MMKKDITILSVFFANKHVLARQVVDNRKTKSLI